MTNTSQPKQPDESSYRRYSLPEIINNDLLGLIEDDEDRVYVVKHVTLPASGTRALPGRLCSANEHVVYDGSDGAASGDDNPPPARACPARRNPSLPSEGDRMTSVEHITVNTGHVRQSPRFEVPDLVIDVIRAALAEGANLWAGWRVRIIPPPDGGHVFDLLHVDRWIVRCWLCEDPAASEAIWESARESVLTGSFLLSGFPIPPVSTPWLAAALTVESALVGMRTPHVLLECGDAERCVAWAMLK